MQLLTAYLTKAALRSTPFEADQPLYPTLFPFMEGSPGGIYKLKVTPYLAGGDARESVPPPELMAQWSPDNVRDEALHLLAQGPLEVAITGDVDEQAAVAAVAATLGTLPPRPDYNAPTEGANIRAFPEPEPDPIVFTHNGLPDQAMGIVNFPTIDVLGPRLETRQLSVLQAVLRLRATDKIREELALAYSIAVTGFNSPDYEDYGYIRMLAKVEPEKLPVFYDAVREIVEDLQTDLVDDDELRRAREPMLDDNIQARDRIHFWHRQNLASFYRENYR